MTEYIRVFVSICAVCGSTLVILFTAKLIIKTVLGLLAEIR